LILDPSNQDQDQARKYKAGTAIAIAITETARTLHKVQLSALSGYLYSKKIEGELGFVVKKERKSSRCNKL
jgi:hypothetical protein